MRGLVCVAKPRILPTQVNVDTGKSGLGALQSTLRDAPAARGPRHNDANITLSGPFDIVPYVYFRLGEVR